MFPSHDVSQSRCFPVTKFPSHDIVTRKPFSSHDVSQSRYIVVIVTKNGAKNSYQVQFFNVENDHGNHEIDVPALLEGVFILKLTNDGPFDVTATKIEI